jgi:glycosyltransferase involved in cell wall biosynthesis
VPHDGNIRVLRIIPTIDPEVGGPSSSTVNAAIAETEAGVSTTLLTTVGRGTKSRPTIALRRLQRAGVRTITFSRLEGTGEKSGTWGVSVQMSTWLLRNARAYDLIHLHYVWSLPTILGSTIGALAGIPVVLTGHESLTRYDIDVASRSGLRRRAKLLLRSLIMRHVSVVVCASELELRTSLDDGEAGVVVAHPVVENVPRERIRADGRAGLVLGSIGRLHSKKNVDRLMYAISEIGDSSIHLIICGAGSRRETARLHLLATKLDLDDQIEWRGQVDGAGRKRLFEQCDATVMASEFESFGMAAAEAIAAGLPVIITRSTGLAAIAEEYDCGIVPKSGGIEDLVEAIVRFSRLDAERREALSANSLEAARRTLTFRVYGERIVDLYRSLHESVDDAEAPSNVGRRVLWVIPRIDPSAGGPSSTAVNAVLAEAERGMDVTIVFTESSESRSSTSQAMDRMAEAGVNVLSFPARSSNGLAAAWGLNLRMLAWILRNVGNFDVIHLQYVWAATTLIGSLGGRLRSVPVVLTPHESLTSFDIDITSGSQLKRRLKLLLRPVILTNVDVIAFSSELERSDSSTLGRPNVVVYHAVCESPRPTALPEPSGPDLVMGFLGRLHPKKNLDVLIGSVSLLGSGRYRLIVAGGGPKAYESELKQRAVKLGVEDRIEWKGQISHDEREGFFGELHLLLMPSEYECFGMVAAEAMATGVPPVVSGNTGIAKQI